MYHTFVKLIYRKTSNISRTLFGNKFVDNSDVVGASPVSAAPTTDMPLLRVNTEISVFYTPSLCCLCIVNYLRILLISLKKY